MLDLTGSLADNSSCKIQVCCFLNDNTQASKIVHHIKTNFSTFDVSALNEFKQKPSQNFQQSELIDEKVDKNTKALFNFVVEDGVVIFPPISLY